MRGQRSGSIRGLWGREGGERSLETCFFCLIRRFYRSPVSPAVLAPRLSDAFNRRARYAIKRNASDLRARHTGEVAGGSMAGKFDLGLHRVGMINNLLAYRATRYPCMPAKNNLRRGILLE